MPADESGRAQVALALAAAAGPFFVLDRVRRPPPDGWLPLARLIDDGDVLHRRVGAARHFLEQRVGASVELRACASITMLGAVSRLVAPALATGLLGGVVVPLSPDDVWCRPFDTGPMPIAICDPARAQTVDDVAEALRRLVIDPVVLPLADAHAREFGLSTHVLYGNIASALAGAATQVAATGRIPHDTAADVVAAVLAGEPLTGSGGWGRPVRGRPRVFVRRNCCLFYRVPGGGHCGDCVLVPSAARGRPVTKDL